jgi:beta-galactosidase
LSGFGSRLAATQVEASIAILWSYDQIWAQKARLQYPALRYDAEVAAYHRAVTELGWTADLVAPTADLSRYALVIAPMLTLVRDDILANLAEYVRTGGQLVLTCQSGVKSWSNVVFDVTWPEPLAEMLGMTVREFDAPPPGETNGVWYGGRRYTVDGWLEVLEPQGAEVLGQYDAKFYAGSAAVTRNRFDRGTVTYVGVRHQPELARVLVADAMGEPDRPMLPRGVFCTTRQGEGGRFTFYVNMQPTEAEVTVYRPGRDVIAGHAVTPGRIRLGSWDVAVIEED